VFGSILNGAIFEEAELLGANLKQTSLIGTDFRAANISGSMIYGISAWDLKIDSNKETNRSLEEFFAEWSKIQLQGPS
jgi:uncharacterized protein YjbI with pentapeptide repeats